MYERYDHGTSLTTTRFQFTGRGGEYFSIWIVNLLLSIVTLGIYSAWAKVRREQYFHRNTLLDGQPFDYTGKPLSILIGRVLALMVIGAITMMQHIDPILWLVGALIFLCIFPWVMVRSLSFRARNTRYRNLSFRFSGTMMQAFGVYFWIGLAALPATIVMAYYSVDLASMQAKPNALDASRAASMGVQLAIAIGLSAVLFMLFFPLYLFRIRAFVHRHLHYGTAMGNFDATAGQFYRLMFSMSGRYFLVFIAIGMTSFVAIKFNMPLLFIAAYFLIFVPQAIYHVMMTNLTYEHVGMGEIRFDSDMKILSYATLLLTNALLLIVTLGLAWPWVAVRLAKYRVEHMSMIASPEMMDAVIGVNTPEKSALGEEAAEFLDFDVSL